MTDELSIWKKIEVMADAFGKVAVPIIVALVGYWYTQATKEREVQGKFVELAVGILRTEPSEDTQNLRAWASDILNAYSGVPITAKAKNELVKLGPIPTVNTATPNSECLEDLLRGQELINAGDRDGGLAYVKRAQELYCGK